MIHENRALLHGGQRAVRSERHLPQIIVISDTGEDEIAAAYCLCRCPPESAAVFGSPPLCLCGGAVIDRDDMAALVFQVTCHRIAHDAEAEKRGFCHLKNS